MDEAKLNNLDLDGFLNDEEWVERESSGLYLSGFESSDHTFSLPCLITH